ncbi:MAG: site-specific DNA-methyltransferase [Synergistaceae bacterium]|nr:site-specific DNA-methyltransferase [Synergistaceae bacterium]MBR0250907.1 site-specific DNA-methyltransferase [Synergistaceae bacterium]
MEIERIAPYELRPYEGNPRIHSDKQIEKLKASINEYGFVLPVLIDANNVIIAGHAIVRASIELKLSEIPCVRAGHLTEAQIHAYILADNRLAEDSEWDKPKLKAEMLRLRDEYGLELEHTGFEKREILRLRMDIAEEPKDEDALPEPVSNPVTIPGDIWLLGEHRLICGSSTDKDTVQKLLAGTKPHLMITDPPYGVNYKPEWRNEMLGGESARTGQVLNDDNDDWRNAWKLFPGDVAYVWHASLHCRNVADSLESCGFIMRNQIIWVKPNFALSRGDYHWQHECCWYAVREEGECPEIANYCEGYDACLYAVRKNQKSHWQGSRSESTVWQIGFNEDTKTTHGTQKPVECMRRPMLNNSEPNEIIYEPFCGSGTTIIAAESCRRICYAVELNPEYVDMTIKRFQAYANQSVILEGDGRSFDEIAGIRSEVNE